MIVSFAFVPLGGTAPPVTGVSQLSDRHVVIWCNLDRMADMPPVALADLDLTGSVSTDGDGSSPNGG